MGEWTFKMVTFASNKVDMAKKVKENILNLEAILFKCRDILRQAKNSGSFFEKRDMMLTLLIIKGSLETDN